MNLKRTMAAALVGAVTVLSAAHSANAHTAVVSCQTVGMLHVSNDHTTRAVVNFYGAGGATLPLGAPAFLILSGGLSLDVRFPSGAVAYDAAWSDGFRQPVQTFGADVLRCLPPVPTTTSTTSTSVPSDACDAWQPPSPPIEGCERSRTSTSTTSTTAAPKPEPSTTSSTAVVSTGGPTTTPAPEIGTGTAVRPTAAPEVADVSVTTTAAGRAVLPFTGANTTAALWGALALLVGCLLVWLARKGELA